MREYLLGTIKKVSNIFLARTRRHVPEIVLPKKISTVIAGVGKYVPDNIVTSASIEERLELEEKLNIKSGMIEKLTGVKERRHAANKEVSSDMALKASEMAIKKAGISPDEIDLIVFASASHDVAEPATANILQEKLKAYNAHVFDAKNACNSFLNAIDIVDAFIQTGRCRVALVAAGEVLSPFINWDINTFEELGRGFAALTLGDGGGAMVLTASDEVGRGIQKSYFTSDGSTWELATIKSGGTLCPFDPSQAYFVSESAEINRLAIRHIPPILKSVLEKIGWRPEDVDLAVPHQVTQQIIERISKHVGIPFKKCMVTLTKYGNTAAASIPIALAEAIEEGRIHKGSKVMLVGGASGFSVGTIAVIF